MQHTWSVYSNVKMYAHCLYMANVNGFVKNRRPPRVPELAAALYLALSLAVGHHWCIFQSELIHTAGLWIATAPDIKHAKYLSGVSDTSAMTSDRVFDNSHCAIVTHVNKHRFASDVRHLSAIYQNLPASKKSAKIVQCELGITW